ncbi:tripartite tricarboxylate transporter TctB family protein [Noviherbaspirillum massiliense]|uniref:tripartite tricarboxylate transporter TctB family protein n=1 Tax=Noviherbaspirillum massiliense TaxID=1465823 RepID=UPI000308147D|nr:tripartite tricarboxylate transporter TctB family protein [Noviherbaspirillum massiliense]
MSDFNHGPAESGADAAPVVAHRIVEIAVALFTAFIGALVMAGSYEQGIGWNETGPESGYFPFYIGLIMLAASCGTIIIALKQWRTLAAGFIARGPFRHVMAVFIPICVYGVAIRILGMYLASALFIAWFMGHDRGEGGEGRRYGLLKIALVSAGTVFASYLIFERWFELPLHTGMLVEWLG